MNNLKRKKKSTRKNRRVNNIRGGEPSLKNIITIGILCWKSPATLKNTLESYKKHNLFDLATPIIYFQERNADSDTIAKEYGIHTILGTNKNVGIMHAFYEMVKTVKTPYFIFAECDFELIENKEKTTKILQDCVKLMKEENVKLIKLRHRKNPGYPVFSRTLLPKANANLPKHNFKGFKFKLEAISFLNKPENTIKNTFIIRETPNYNYKWYICNFSHNKWSNNIFIIDMAFLKEYIVPMIEKKLKESSETVNLEGVIWQNMHLIETYLIAAGDGLFTHNRIDR